MVFSFGHGIVALDLMFWLNSAPRRASSRVLFISDIDRGGFLHYNLQEPP